MKDTIAGLFQTGQIDLPVESGIIKTAEGAKWVTVTFKKRFLSTPSVVVQGSFQSGTLKRYTVDIPSITVPSISLPSITIPKVAVPNVTVPTIAYHIPRLNIVDMLSGYNSISTYMGAQVRQQFINATTALNWFPANVARDVVATGTSVIGEFIGTFFDWFVSDYIQPHFDNVESILKGIRSIINDDIIGQQKSPKAGSINKAFDTLETSLQTALDNVVNRTNDAFKVVRDSTQKAFNDVKTGIDTTAKSVETSVESAINDQVARLYEYLGILDGAPFVPTKIANVTNYGFQFYSTGKGEYHWVSVGI